jgi:hypothetical protein
LLDYLQSRRTEESHDMVLIGREWRGAGGLHVGSERTGKRDSEGDGIACERREVGMEGCGDKGGHRLVIDSDIDRPAQITEVKH